VVLLSWVDGQSFLACVHGHDFGIVLRRFVLRQQCHNDSSSNSNDNDVL
jgi:hypothetical protein